MATYQSNAIGDCYVDSFQPTTVLNGVVLAADLSGSSTKWFFLYFNLKNSIPAGSTIDSANLRLQLITGASDGTVRLVRCVTPWNEASLTWNIAQGHSYGTATVDFASTSKGTYNIDVKTIVQEIIDEQTTGGIRGIKQTGATWARFDSKDGGAVPPQITVNYTPATGGGLRRGAWRGTWRGIDRGVA